MGAHAGFQLTIPEGAATGRPLVCCLGWYGCADRHLAKYSGLLNQHGYATVRAILPPLAVFSPVAVPRRRFAARLLDFLGAVDPEGSRPVVFYVFSNGGAFALEQIELLVQGEPRYKQYRSRIAGVVFDSAPCYMHATVGAAAAGQGRSPLVRLLAAALFYLSVLILFFVAPRQPQRFWKRMQDMRLGSRTLYLFSADDPLCDAAKLDALVASRRQAGADVAATRWERSQHVGHLVQHYKEYSAALLGFLHSLPAKK